MNKFLQILCYAATFLLFLAIGNFLEFITDDYVRTLQDDLPGKPLPFGTLFIIHNHLAISYIFLFPWLLFVGLPLFSFVWEPYWDSTRFLLRFSAFLSLELLLLFIVLFFYCIPFIGISGGMSDEGPPPLTWTEFSMRGLFWIIFVLVVVAALWRSLGNRNPKG
jgi:hypothetical protein